MDVDQQPEARIIESGSTGSASAGSGPTTSTPKTEKKLTFRKPSKAGKLKSKPDLSQGQSPSSSSSKRNRSGNKTPTGLTPEPKKQGLCDDAIEAFGDFSNSSGLDGGEESLNEIEELIVSNKFPLKRTAGAALETEEPVYQSRKEQKMAKRTGIEIRFFGLDGEDETGLSTSAWTSVKDSVQEYLFDQNLLVMFDKIVSTPYNTQDNKDCPYGAITFGTVEEAELMNNLVKDVPFKFAIRTKLIKPSRYVVRFRVYGMLMVSPKKIVNAMMQLNGLTEIGNYLEFWTKTVPDAPGCRQFVLTPDDKLLEEFKRREAEGDRRLKTGFNTTTFRIIEAE